MGIKVVKVVALLLCVASGLRTVECNGCSYRFVKPSMCEEWLQNVTITCFLEGPQNGNLITKVTWYKRDRGNTSNWASVDMQPAKFQNPYSIRDVGNGMREIDASLNILRASEADSGCYFCYICLLYYECAPSNRSLYDEDCYRSDEQCLDARTDPPLCSKRINVVGAAPPAPTTGTSATTARPPTNASDEVSRATESRGDIAEAAFYGGIAVCLVLTVTSALLIVVIIVLCANKGRPRKKRNYHDDRTRTVADTGYIGSSPGNTLLTNVNSDGTLSSSGASSSSSGTLLTVPSFNGTLISSPVPPATESSFADHITRGRLSQNHYSIESTDAQNDVSTDRSRPPMPRQSTPVTNPLSPRLASPSSTLSPTTGVHHYHVLELRPVSDVVSDTAGHTQEDSWCTVTGLSVPHQRAQKTLRSPFERAEPATVALSAEGGIPREPSSRSAAECCRYTKLDLSAIGPRHDYAKRSIQADPAANDQ